MAYSSHYGPLLESPAARPRRKRTPLDVFRDHADRVDLEFSEYARDPRFIPGWFILPGVMLGAAIIMVLLSMA